MVIVAGYGHGDTSSNPGPDWLHFSMLLLYILWDDWPIFMISDSNEQLQQELEYTQLKPDYHSWGISKMQSGREDTLEERYAIKFCFKLGKNAIEMCGMLHTAFQPSCMKWASVFEWHKCNGYRRRNWTRRHEFKSWTDCISHSTNTLGKGMNPNILPPAMGK